MPRYTALDAARLISDDGENFLCENCKGELVAESDKFAAQEVGDADDNVRRRRREKLKEMLQKLEVCEFVDNSYTVTPCPMSCSKIAKFSFCWCVWEYLLPFSFILYSTHHRT